nr:T9SS type A sorting domain-containing protein [Membranihabitans marinus]
MGDNGGYGEPVGSLSAGTSQTLTLEAAIPNGLESQDIYVVAWVEERKPTLDNRYEIIIHNSVSQTTSTITNNELAIPDADLSIYPNPASDVLILNNVSEFQPHSVRIMDAAGREVKNMSIRQRIQIQDLQVGQYFLILEDDAHQVIRKFIKQ